MSLDGVIDAPDITQQAAAYFAGDQQHDAYQKERLFAADALLLGRKTYEQLSKAYLGMATSGKGAPREFVERMNSIPKFVASFLLGHGTHLFDNVDITTHLRLSDVKRFASGTMVLEYVPKP